MRYLGFLALLGACGDKDDDTSAEDTTGGGDARAEAILALDGDDAAGATVYSDKCATCHAADGSGDIGPSLIVEVPEHATDQELLEHILAGEGVMPPFDSLPDQDLADLVAYLRATFPGE